MLSTDQRSALLGSRIYYYDNNNVINYCLGVEPNFPYSLDPPHLLAPKEALPCNPRYTTIQGEKEHNQPRPRQIGPTDYGNYFFFLIPFHFIPSFSFKTPTSPGDLPLILAFFKICKTCPLSSIQWHIQSLDTPQSGALSPPSPPALRRANRPSVPTRSIAISFTSIDGPLIRAYTCSLWVHLWAARLESPREAICHYATQRGGYYWKPGVVYAILDLIV